MNGAELILALLIAVAALVTIARRLGVAYPIFLVIGGLALGVMPGVPRIEIDPDVIFLIVLPPLLYIAGYFTPIRSLRENLTTISSLAVGLVIASACAVAAVAHALVPGMPWSVAMVLGAIVAPPDAVAAIAITRPLAVPRQIVTILEGESLLADAPSPRQARRRRSRAQSSAGASSASWPDGGSPTFAPGSKTPRSR